MKKPNILLITSDQHHYSAIGAVNSKISTPALDSLASEGMLFERAYCTNPTCTPSRSSILTGMFASKHGAWSLGTKLFESVPTINDYLKPHGYRTAIVGKAHFQPLHSNKKYPSEESLPLLFNLDYWRKRKDSFYGFDTAYLSRGHSSEGWIGQHYAAWLEDNGLKNYRKYFSLPGGRRLFVKKDTRWKLPEKYHYNIWIKEKVNKVLDECKKNDQPFFIWASFPDPHSPHVVPAPWDKMYKPENMEIPAFNPSEHDKNPPYFAELLKKHPKLKQYRETGYAVHGLHRHYISQKRLKRRLAIYYGMVSFMDKYIGEIFKKLKQLQLDEDTIIIFTTDHGEFFGQHGILYKCITHYEDMLRVPLIVKYKNHIPPKTVSKSLQSNIDILPTILSYCGIEIPKNIDGVNQSEVWSGGGAQRTFAIVENRHEPTLMNLRTYIENKYKMTVHCKQSYGEFYDLEKDPFEHDNLWDNPNFSQQKFEVLTRFYDEECKKKGIPPLTFHNEKNLLNAIFNIMLSEQMPMPRIAHA